jgi:branched-chain amino acid transport system ATP-binding protein
VLTITGLGAGYGRVQVLWEVELAVERNEIVALVGPNGAGKTTLLRALSGMIPIRAGSARFQGHDLVGRSVQETVELGIAHVPEVRRLFAGLTVRDNLLLGGWRRHNRDLDRVIELFPRLGERLAQIAGSLSGGEQQMCAIGRGLMSRPVLLMIDEQSRGLAPNLVDRSWADCRTSRLPAPPCCSSSRTSTPPWPSPNEAMCSRRDGW